MTDDKNQDRKQVIDQCRVVSHLAAALSRVHSDNEKIFKAGYGNDIIELVGQRTANLMETLGDILNGMDATDADDEWMHPIFDAAQKRWPDNN